jgi:hypothetical protein
LVFRLSRGVISGTGSRPPPLPLLAPAPPLPTPSPHAGVAPTFALAPLLPMVLLISSRALRGGVAPPNEPATPGRDDTEVEDAKVGVKKGLFGELPPLDTVDALRTATGDPPGFDWIG